MEICEKRQWKSYLVLTFKNVCASFNPVFFLLFYCLFKYTCMCLYVWYVGQCMCMRLCACVWVCIFKISGFIMTPVFKASFLQNALFCRSHGVIDVCWIKWTNVLLLNILVYTLPQPPKSKNILCILISFSLTYSFTDKLINVHIKLNYYIHLNSFLWCLLNDHAFPLLSE